jgi:raffinose/stachyose/melibiose transport system permease protein
MVNKTKNKIANLFIYIFLGILSAITLGPYIWVFVSSLKENSEIFVGPFTVPRKWLFENYLEAWKIGHLGEYYINSVVVATISVGLFIPLVTLAAYPFSKMNFKGKNSLFALFLFGLAVPFQSYMLSLYGVLKNIHALNTYWGIILPLIGQQIPFGIFFLRSFFKTIPNAVIEAARIDGAKEPTIIWHILMPMSRSAAVSLGIFQLVFTWNAFVIPLLYVNTGKLRTLTLGLMYYSGEYGTNYPLAMAGTIIVSLPLIIIFLIFRRGFIQGISAGAVK